MSTALMALTAGALAWTLLEYLLHRFVFHAATAGKPGVKEHRKHHALGDYFAPWQQKALAAVQVVGVLLPIASVLAGIRLGMFITLGFVAMYLLYEVLHRRAHVAPPGTRYGRWLRKNHFAHHFVDPRRAHGVTTPLWDWVFGTGLAVATVRVPRRLSMVWLVDDGGVIHSVYQSDYVLVGSDRFDTQSRQADRAASMANQRPTD